MKNRWMNWLTTMPVILLLSACGGGGGGGNPTPSAASERVADSGQTQCYYVYSMYPEASTCFGTDGQDGDYTINAMSFTDNGDGTMLDDVTGLTWQKCSLGQSGNDCADGSPASYTWSAAKDQCANLNLDGSGWRLPTVFELTQIVNYGTSNAAIDETAFPRTGLSPYWSSTAHASYTGMAWYVNFAQGNTWLYNQTEPHYVWCVRG